MNESERTVVIELATDERQTFTLPPRSRGHLSESYAPPASEWRLIVRTEACTELASLSLAELAPILTVRVTRDGDVVIRGESVFTFDGKSIPLVAPLPPGTCD